MTEEGKKIMEKKRKAKGKKISKTKKALSWKEKQVCRDQELAQIEFENQKTPSWVGKFKEGRPTLYEDKYALGMVKYYYDHLKGGYYEKTTMEEIAGKNPQAIKKVLIRPKWMPSFAGYALEIGVSSRVLLDRTKAKNEKGELSHPEFLRAYQYCKTINEKMITDLGLTGDYPFNMVKFLNATNLSIYEDKSSQDQTKRGKEINDLNDEEVDEYLNKLIRHD